MILKRLTEFAQRAEGELDARQQPPSMYINSPIRYILDITLDGRPLGMRDTADKENKSGVRRLNPNIGRTTAIEPKLINDTGEYVLGIPRAKSKPKRVADCHESYKGLVSLTATELNLAEVQAVKKFTDSWEPIHPSFTLPENYDPGAVVAFQVNGQFPTDLPEVQKFWAEYTAERAESSSGSLRCIVCGEDKPVLERLPGKIKGIPGGQVAGTALISANADAFLSYGLEASLVAPTCRDCAEKFTYAINTLIRTDNSHLYIGSLVYIFWTRKRTTFDFFNLLDSPTPGAVRVLIESVYKGITSEIENEMDNAFYATSFSASGGRAVLRDWIETTIPEVRRNLARYFSRQRIVDYQGQETVFPLRRLARATIPFRPSRRGEDKLPPLFPQALTRSALHGDPLPFSLLQAAVNRCRAEQGVRSERAALIKMVILNRDITQLPKEDFMMELELNLKEPAYLCGRLLAVIEAVQRAALPGIKATITDRYYGAASSAPASVFGTLLRGAQAHLSKLRKTNMPAFLALDARLQGVLSSLTDNFPKTLTLTAQGQFALGYYHQKAKDRADREARRLGIVEEPHIEAESQDNEDSKN